MIVGRQGRDRGRCDCRQVSRATARALRLSLAGLLCSASVAAQEGQLRVPESLAQGLRPLADVAVLETPAVDGAALLAEDAAAGPGDVPFRFASPFPVTATPAEAGLWEESGAGGTSVWRLRVRSPGALSMNLGFQRYFMPRGGRLSIYTPDYERIQGPFTEEDNESHGELWTSVLPGDEIVIEAAVPTDLVGELQLELDSVNRGYRDLFALESQSSCNVDVACPEADGYRDIIRSVGRISVQGSSFCTGALVNNTSQDGRAYFLTANHCEIDAGNAASVVVYWRYESPVCGGLSGGRLDQSQTGAYYRAGLAATDFTLVELDDVPDRRHNVYWAGWNRGTSHPAPVVGIHHPGAAEKAISLSSRPVRAARFGRGGGMWNVAVDGWDLGTTETGSSGSPLFDRNKQVVGQLRGGNRGGCREGKRSVYGSLSFSWEGGGTRETRLRDWLDPAGTGAMTLAGRDAGADPGSVAGTPEVPVVDPGPGGSGPVWTDFELSDAHLRRIAYGLGAVTGFALLMAFATPRRRIAGAVQRMSRPVVRLADGVRRDSWGRVHPPPRPGPPPPGPPPDPGAGSFTVGRGRECDVRMEDDSVSRVHAEVERLSGGRLHVTDRRSTNGTFVLAGGGWRRIRQRTIAPGDRVRFGAYALTGDELDARCAAAAARRPGGGSPAPAREEQAVDRGQDVVRDPETGEVVVKRGG